MTKRPWLIASGIVVLVIVVAVMIFDWNWFKPTIEAKASAALGRPVTLQHFSVKLRRQPLLVFDGVEIANPPEFPEGSRFGKINRITAKLEWGPLFRKEIVIPEIVIEKPEGDIGPGPTGNGNWSFAGFQHKDDQPVGKPPEIGNLVITDGNFHLVYPKLKADFQLVVKTQPPAKEGDESQIVIDAKGTYNGEALTGHFVGGSVLSFRDPAKPYPVDLQVARGQTKLALKGTLERPLELGGARLQIDMQGPNLSELYFLVGIPLPPTPPYRLRSAIDYEEGKVRLTKLNGTVGNSDLSGDLQIDPKRERPLITGNLTSNKVTLADLGGFVGATPGKGDSPKETQQQKQQREAQKASDRVLPDFPLDLPRIRAADFKIKYTGKRIESDKTPLDNFVADLTIEDGVITLHPLSFGIGKGTIAINTVLDGRQDPVKADAEIDFRQIDLKDLLAKLTDFKGTGLVGGRATIKSTGNSLHQLLGNGDGGLSMYMKGGDMSALLVNLAGLDLGNSLLSLLGIPDRAPLNCMVTNFGLQQGILDSHLLLIDTTEANVLGKGKVNFQTEAIDMQITSEPKQASIGKLPLPINVRGTLKNPTIRPGLEIVVDDNNALSSILGFFTIQLGLGKDHDCSALLETADARAKGKSVAPKKGEPAGAKPSE